MKKLIVLLIVFLPALAFAATDVSFQWDANTEPDLAGYKLYRGTVSGGPYSFVKNVPDGDTTCTDENVADGTYFWVLTAYDDDGFESAYSDEATDTLETSPPAPPQGFSIWQKIIAWLRSILGGYRHG